MVLLALPAQVLSGSGHQVRLSRTFVDEDVAKYDLFVFSKPHASTKLMEAVSTCKRANKRIAIYLDEFYHEMPTIHPDYNKIGPGNPEAMRALEEVLRQADFLFVSSAALSESYKAFCPKTVVLAPGWDQDNPLWNKEAPHRETINLGLIGHHLLAKDASMLLTSLKRLVREYPQALVILGSDTALYSSLSDLPENRTLFLPLPSVEDYPYLLSGVDILLLPHKNSPYNQNRSDLPVLEAGIRRIPWAATPIPSYRAWQESGVFVEKPEDWYPTLKKLIDNPGLREELGTAGRKMAEQRQATWQLTQWQEVFSKLIPDS